MLPPLKYNYFVVTNNITVENAIVYISAILFFITIFPVHLFNYVYINTEDKYAGLNVCAYRYIRFFNLNTVSDKPNEIQVNGKNKKMSFPEFRATAYKIFNKICIFKLVQLADFGLESEKGAYVALAHNAFTQVIYNFIRINRGYTKLKNYTILNSEHKFIRYYAKAVTIINLLVVTKIFLIILMEKINDKIKKQA